MAHSSEDGPTPRNMWAAPNELNGLFKKKRRRKRQEVGKGKEIWGDLGGGRERDGRDYDQIVCKFEILKELIKNVF